DPGRSARRSKAKPSRAAGGRRASPSGPLNATTWLTTIPARLVPSTRVSIRRFTSFRNEVVRHVQPLRSGRPAGEEAGDEGPLNWVAAGRVAPGTWGA